MDAFIHRSQDRGHVNIGWLESKHSFSFGSWYNPKYMGVSALRVINDDVIAGHQGFGQHPHDNMEILTCVLKGTITHKDSMGNHGGISAGEWQLMSAGTGVQHSEMNQGDEPVHLYKFGLPQIKEMQRQTINRFVLIRMSSQINGMRFVAQMTMLQCIFVKMPKSKQL